MKKALNITVLIAIVFIIAGACWLRVVSENKSIYISTGFSGNVIGKVDNMTITKPEVLVALADFKKEYETMFGETIWNEKILDSTFKEYAVNTVKSRLTRQKCMQTLANSRGIVLSNNENNNIEKAAKEYMDSLTKEEKKELMVSEEIVESMLKESIIAKRLFEEITYDVDVEISEDEARVISIQYIRVMNENEARNIKHRLEEGEGFMTVVKENNVEEYECELRRGDTEESFEEAAFTLVTGEISDVVSTSMGFYIILCINDYDKVKTAANKEQIISNRKLITFNDFFEKYENEKYAEYKDTDWDKIDIEAIPNTKISYTQIYDKYFR